MVRGGDDVLRFPDDFCPLRRMKVRQPLCDHRYIARADLEQAIAAEGTSSAALEVLRLLPCDAIEERVGVQENLFVGHRAGFSNPWGSLNLPLKHSLVVKSLGSG